MSYSKQDRLEQPDWGLVQLNGSNNRDPTASPGPFQCLTTLRVNIIFQIHNQNLPCSTFCLVLWQYTLERVRLELFSILL